VWLKRKSQSILEYAILIAVVVAAILIMQTFMKRGVQGRLKDSSEKIGGGTSYSASGTTILEDRAMTSDRNITEVTAVNNTGVSMSGMASNMGLATDAVPTYDTEANKAYSATAVTGGTTTSKTLTKTADAANETYTKAGYDAAASPDVTDFSSNPDAANTTAADDATFWKAGGN